MPNGESSAELTLEDLAAPAATPWARLGLIFTALVLLALGTAGLVYQLLQQRPLDLREMTERLARDFEQSLQAHQVPVHGILPGEAEYQDFDRGGGWYFFPYQVTLPETLSVPQLMERLRDDMAVRGVGVETAEHEDGRLALSLTLNSAPFVMAVLSHPAPEILNLRAASTRTANDLVQILRDHGGEVGLTRGPEDREDTTARWTFSEFQVRFRGQPDFTALQGALAERLRGQHATAILGEGATGAYRLEGLLQGRLVARMSITVAAATPPASGGSAPPSERPEAPAAPVEPPLPLPEAMAPPVAPPAPPDIAEPLSTAIQTPHLPTQEELPLESAESQRVPLEPSEPELGPLAKRRGPALTRKPRLALIIDDGGYGGERTERLLKLDTRLTLAILPNTPFAEDTARRAAEKGFQVMLHMPMETYGGPASAFPGEIRTNMAAEEIERLTLDALSQIPGVVGVNNHTGSKYTRDAEKMAEFLKVIQQKELFFIDSLTITKSAAYTTAQSLGIPSAQRDLFIDNSSSPALIRSHFRQLVERAIQRGQAIGIGHFRTNTVKVLEEELPKLEAYGVELVHVSELLQ